MSRATTNNERLTLLKPGEYSFRAADGVDYRVHHERSKWWASKADRVVTWAYRLAAILVALDGGAWKAGRIGEAAQFLGDVVDYWDDGNCSVELTADSEEIEGILDSTEALRFSGHAGDEETWKTLLVVMTEYEFVAIYGATKIVYGLDENVFIERIY